MKKKKTLKRKKGKIRTKKLKMDSSMKVKKKERRLRKCIIRNGCHQGKKNGRKRKRKNERKITIEN